MRTLIVALALLAAACGTPDGQTGGDPTSTTSPPVSTTVPPTSTTTSPGDVIDIDPDGLQLVVVPDADGGFSADPPVGCNGDGGFPLSAVGGISPIDEADPDGYLAAIASFLENEEGQFWPQEDWQLLWAGDDAAYLVTKTEQGTLAWMFLENDGADWKWAGSSMAGDSCQLRVASPGGMNTVDWRLDPAHPEPTSDSTEIHLLLTERECVSGQEIGDRLRGPQVVLTPGEARIVFVAETPPGDAFNCQGNPDMAYVIELPEPLGDRELVDGFDVGVTLDDYVG